MAEELSAIAKTDETYISFSINLPVGTYKKQSGQLVKLYQSLRFLDSYQFLSQSLENLAKTEKDDFFLLNQFFHKVPGQFFLKLTQKGFFLLTVTSTVLKSSKSLFQIMVKLGKIVSLVISIVLILTIKMQSVFTMILVAKTWETITTGILKLMCFFLLIFLKSSEVSAQMFTSCIPPIFFGSEFELGVFAHSHKG